MAKVHFLNVKNGDCNIIQHDSGNITMIDVNQAGSDEVRSIIAANLSGYNNKHNPTDPITYLKSLSVRSIQRFILSHPDMDHLGGIKKLFDEFNVINFWDTANTKTLSDFGYGCSEEDWRFYEELRNGNVVKRLVYYAGDTNLYYNKDENGGPGDNLYILAPTPEIVKEANRTEEWNDCSYVLLFKTGKFKIILAGDSDDTSWEYILEKHKDLISDVDVLIAPHHGRDSSRKWDFLEVLKPKLVLLGNAPSEHIAYSQYGKHGETLTNNKAGDVIIEHSGNWLNIYIKSKEKAQEYKECAYSAENDAYYIGFIGDMCHLKKRVTV